MCVINVCRRARAGATLNARRIRVSEVDNLNRPLSPDFPTCATKTTLRALWLTMNAQAVRRDGSAALDLAYVACGRFDAFWEEGLRPWDVAAGALIIEEAGGRATQFDGSPYDIYAPPFLASNHLIHEAMLRVFNQ
ncbi:MAG: inositol monophosphatase family protein [Pyrinomonadaceae bacterium]